MRQLRHNSVTATLALFSMLAIVTGVPALGQLSADSWWPKFQRDPQNTGRAPAIGIATDAHISAFAQLSPPIPTENHATPVFAPGNSRLYIGGPNSRLSAVHLDTFTVAWQLTLGDGTGAIFHTPAIAADGSIFVGAWDNQAPFDGFSKVRDDGDHATIVWTVPLRRMLAGPTITDDGLVVIGGRHDTLGWGYFAFRDAGETAELSWSAAIRANPNDPASTG
ncbi:MAG: PQQ-like beta-propeller repeat protein, partial [Phycisphaerales bacterium]|nr:PQQ-like beta-propeller repeat protein [Phycisphaerales bacterium]